MSKIVLVHGFGIGLRLNINRILLRKSRKYSDHLGFGAFYDLIKSGTAVVFPWYEQRSYTLTSFLSISTYLNTYKVEKQKSISAELQKKFEDFLIMHKPEILLGHSMGCFLIINYVNKYGLPDYVKKIVFVQADVETGFEIKNQEILKRLEAKDLSFINYYCPWDTTLMFSLFLNRKVPTGLFGSSNKYIQNKLFPLYKVLNLHTSSINDKRLVREVFKLG